MSCRFDNKSVSVGNSSHYFSHFVASSGSFFRAFFYYPSFNILFRHTMYALHCVLFFFSFHKMTLVK